MKSIFEELYEQERAIKDAYENASRQGDEAGQEQARADINELLEKVDERGKTFARVYREYRTSRERGNEWIDLHDVIWDNEVSGLIACMRENGIERFTFSSTWSSAVETAWLFKENGCTLEELRRVNC